MKTLFISDLDGTLLTSRETISEYSMQKLNSLIDVFFDLWKEEPRTALFVTHDVEEAYILSHRAVVLERGRAAADLADASPVPRRYGEASSYRQAILSALLSGTANT